MDEILAGDTEIKGFRGIAGDGGRRRERTVVKDVFPYLK
jgi:hypothetical protein